MPGRRAESDGGRLLALAEAVGDRSSVDWEQESFDDPAEAAALRHLREIAAVAAVLGAGAGVDAAAEAAAEADTADEDEAGADVLFRWGHLEVIEPIGAGSFGEVYRARDPVLGRDVALKLRRRGPADAEYSNRAFVDEARRLARIDHPNVVRVLGADVHDGRVGLWTELLEGSDLGEILARDGRMTPSEAVTIAIELCRALAAVHAAGLVHGDLKAENVVRDRHGRLVLTDFGAGAELVASGRSIARSGTPVAMAPELLEGGPPNERTDLYALGALLYRLLTGRHPIEAEDVSELRRRHRDGGPVPILDVRPDLAPVLVEIVETALEAEPEARFASAGQLERRLRGVLAGRPSRGGRVSGSPAWARVWVAASVAGVLGVAGIAVWAWLESSRPRLGPESAAAVDTTQGVVEGAPQEAGPESPGELGASPDLPIELALRRVTAGGVEILDDGSTIRPGDQLFLDVRPEETLHLYVLNQDLAGELFVLFPLDGVSPTNPLRAGESYRLPGEQDGVPLDWRVTSAGGTESFLFVVAQRRLEELERELESMVAASLGRNAEAESADGVVLRGVGGLTASRRAAGGDRLGALAEWLGGLQEQGERVWLERIDLANP